MQVKFSKGFQKEYLKQSGKVQKSLLKALEEVIQAKIPEDISDCKKLSGLKNIYRIRIGGLRAFFVFHIVMENGYAYFVALLRRGHAYDKKSMKKLRGSDFD